MAKLVKAADPPPSEEEELPPEEETEETSSKVSTSTAPPKPEPKGSSAGDLEAEVAALRAEMAATVAAVKRAPGGATIDIEKAVADVLGSKEHEAQHAALAELESKLAGTLPGTTPEPKDERPARGKVAEFFFGARP